MITAHFSVPATPWLQDSSFDSVQGREACSSAQGALSCGYTAVVLKMRLQNTLEGLHLLLQILSLPNCGRFPFYQPGLVNFCHNRVGGQAQRMHSNLS